MTSPAETMSPAELAEFARLWDQLIQFLLSLSDADQAAALADPGALLDRCGLGDVDGSTLQSAIVNSDTYRNAEGSGGGSHTHPPAPDVHPRPGETPEEAAERVMNYYIDNSYTEIVDQSTNIDGDVYGDVTTRNVNGDHNQVGDHSSFGDNIDGDGVITGNGNTVVSGNGNESAFGQGSSVGSGNVVGNSGVVGDGNTTGFGSGATTSIDSSHSGNTTTTDSGNTTVTDNSNNSINTDNSVTDNTDNSVVDNSETTIDVDDSFQSDSSTHDSYNPDSSVHDSGNTTIDVTP